MPIPLTLEQGLYMKNLEYQVKRMSHEQLEELCLQFATSLMRQRNEAAEMYKSLALDGTFDPPAS